MTNYNLYITGMFRSGTTFLSRLLDSHYQVAISSDTLLHFFKNIRYEVKKGKDLIKNQERFLDNYFFDLDEIKTLEHIESFDSKKILKEHVWKFLIEYLEENYRKYSNKLIGTLKGSKPNNYKKAIQLLFNLIAKNYGDENTKIVGIKEVWGIEFIPFLIKNLRYPKIIVIIRDPRAVYTSKQNTKNKYPIYFICNQWRKIFALAHYYKNKFDRKVFILKYEELILKPEKTINQICDFLGLNFYTDLLNLKRLKDGNNKNWSQNSNFKSRKREFDINAVDRWSKYILKREKKFIEYLCYHEMKRFGYEVNDIDKKSLNSDYLTEKQINLENSRHDLISQTYKLDNEIKTKKFFLKTYFYKYLRNEDI